MADRRRSVLAWVESIGEEERGDVVVGQAEDARESNFTDSRVVIVGLERSL